MEEEARRDEEDLIEGLTKLSNRATLHQLSDFVTMDSELDDAIPEEDGEDVVVIAAVQQHNTAVPRKRELFKNDQPLSIGHHAHHNKEARKNVQSEKPGHAATGKKLSRQDNSSLSSASPFSSLEMSPTSESRSPSRASSDELKFHAKRDVRSADRVIDESISSSAHGAEIETEVPLPAVTLQESATVEASSHFPLRSVDETDGAQSKEFRQVEKSKAHSAKPHLAVEANGQGHSSKRHTYTKGKEQSRHSLSDSSNSDIELPRIADASIETSPHSLNMDMDVEAHDNNGTQLQVVPRSDNRGVVDSFSSLNQTLLHGVARGIDSSVVRNASSESEWKMAESKRSYVTEEEVWDTVEKTKSYVNRDGLHDKGQPLNSTDGISINGPVFDKLENNARASAQLSQGKPGNMTKTSVKSGKNSVTDSSDLPQMNAGFTRNAGTVRLTASDEDTEHIKIEELRSANVEAPLKRSIAARKVVLPTLDGSSSSKETDEEDTIGYFEVGSRRIPLPNFDSDDRHKVVDLDDITHVRDAEESHKAAAESRYRDISFKNTYGNLFNRSISVYSNSGVNRVSSDEGPLFMHVPRSTGSVHIGDK